MPHGSGVDKYAVENTCYEIIRLKKNRLKKSSIKETTGKYHLIAGNSDITAAEIKLNGPVFARSPIETMHWHR